MVDFFINFKSVGGDEAASAATNLKQRLEEAGRASDNFNRDIQRRITLIREENKEAARSRTSVDGAQGFNRPSAPRVNGSAGIRLAASAGGIGPLGSVLGQASPGLMAMGGAAFAAAAVVRIFSTGLANAEKNLIEFNSKVITLRTTIEDAKKDRDKSGVALVGKSGADLRRVGLSGDQALISSVLKSPELVAVAAKALGAKSSEQVLSAVEIAREAGRSGFTDSLTAFDAAIKSGIGGTSDASVAKLIRRTGQRNVTEGDVSGAFAAQATNTLVGNLSSTLNKLSEIETAKFNEGITSGTSNRASMLLSEQLKAAQNPVVAAQEAQIDAMRRNTAALEAAAAGESAVLGAFRETSAILGRIVTFGVGEFDGSNKNKYAREQSQISQVARLVETQ